MAWKYIPNDDFDSKYLEGLHTWFMQDLRACNDWRNLLNSYPDKLKGRYDTIKLADSDLKVSRDNLEKCIEAIKIARKKEVLNELEELKTKKPTIETD